MFKAIIGASVFTLSAMIGPAAAGPAAPQAVSCKLVRNVNQLDAIRNHLAESYCLANDIDAGSIANFTPIGDLMNPFTGKLFGNGYVIKNLTINSSADYVGLFGAIDHAVVQDLGLL